MINNLKRKREKSEIYLLNLCVHNVYNNLKYEKNRK